MMIEKPSPPHGKSIQKLTRSEEVRTAHPLGETDVVGNPSEGAEHASRGELPQSEKFAAAAREHGASEDEEAFKDVLRKLAKPKD